MSIKLKKLNEAIASLQIQEITSEVLMEKYAKFAEQDVDDIRRRVAIGIASVEAEEVRHDWVSKFVWAMENGFIPAGRINSAAGTDIGATLVNCFVQGVGDAVSEDKDGKPSIYKALAQAAETMRRGGGVGYNFSAIRPKGGKVKGTHSQASGPISYMHVFDRSCETVESAGARRGAQMGMLNVSHPDIEEFIHAKDGGALTNFNLSVAVSDAFMRAVESNGSWELVHKAEPSDELIAAGAYRRGDGLWVYKTVKAQDLWTQIMVCTYDHAEPGIIFIDNVNNDNNLSYCEVIEATNPCAEEPLPPYGCCCLGSLNLTMFVNDPFGDAPSFDFKKYEQVIQVAVRFLDNVLSTTYWPLQEQAEESRNKRRVGLGYTGLGDALIMMKLRYDSVEAREMARKITEALRDYSYTASVAIAQEKGPFPLLDVEQYLASGAASRLPNELKSAIREHGIRNSHLNAIAPTGTISLAFADNASNGIEPPFAWFYTRKKRMPDGSKKEIRVEDHAWRLYKEMGGDVSNLPSYFVTALEMSAKAHMDMVAVANPYIDSAISKTVNVPADYPYNDFKDLYFLAWKAGLKGLSTYRPNTVLGSVLSVEPTAASPSPAEKMPASVEDLQTDDANRRVTLKDIPAPVLDSLRYPSRPEIPGGNISWTFMARHPGGKFAIFVGQSDVAEGGPDEGFVPWPFEVWATGPNVPRGLPAIAKTLSMDMRANDRSWLKKKLETLAKTPGEAPFDCPMPPYGEAIRVPSAVAAFAKIIQWRVDDLGWVPSAEHDSPVLDALMSPKEPKTGPDGTLSWTVDIINPATGEDFVMGLKEIRMPDGTTRPYSMWLSGNYPKSYDGLCKILSLDMRVVDPAWIGMKLSKLLDYSEALGDFMAKVPGGTKQKTYPSTIAYLAALILHRHVMLGILSEDGTPISRMGVLRAKNEKAEKEEKAIAGKLCTECGNHSVIKKDGCDFCTSCGNVGSCG